MKTNFLRIDNWISQKYLVSGRLSFLCGIHCPYLVALEIVLSFGFTELTVLCDVHRLIVGLLLCTILFCRGQAVTVAAGWVDGRGALLWRRRLDRCGIV